MLSNADAFRLFEIARLLVRLNHTVSFIANANHRVAGDALRALQTAWSREVFL
jgi:hypothetical protein